MQLQGVKGTRMANGTPPMLTFALPDASATQPDLWRNLPIFEIQTGADAYLAELGIQPHLLWVTSVCGPLLCVCQGDSIPIATMSTGQLCPPTQCPVRVNR
jgi:hypothetical protein